MMSAEQSDSEHIVGCSVKNINVLDDFAKVNHIFCDKTGTLTKNELIFRSLGCGKAQFHAGSSFNTELK